MATLIIKTRSEQKLEWLNSERAVRRLTDEEWRELSRAEHAVYCHARKPRSLAAFERENAELLAKVEREAGWR